MNEHTHGTVRLLCCMKALILKVERHVPGRISALKVAGSTLWIDLSVVKKYGSGENMMYLWLSRVISHIKLQVSVERQCSWPQYTVPLTLRVLDDGEQEPGKIVDFSALLPI